MVEEPRSASDDAPRRPRALALRALGLGDLLAGVPALRLLRRTLPDHEIVLAAPEPLRPLVDLVGAVDRLLPVGELEPVPWTGPPPEVAVDLHGNGPASRRLLEALSPGRLVAFEVPGQPRWNPEEHERQRWCRLVEVSLGGSGDPDAVRIDAPPVPSPAPGAVVVHPGAASASRRWPAERWAAVARWAGDQGHPVVVTGSPAEADLAADVARAAGGTSYGGRTDLAGLAALVRSAALVLSGDTGVAHLASAYARPSVVLFGPTPPAWWGPPAGGPHTALWHGTGRGDPHDTAIDPALDAIGVDEVVAAAALRLRRRPAAVLRAAAAGRSTTPSA